MVTHYTFHHELINLNKKLLKMSAMVEDRVRKAATVIKTRDQDLIQSLIMSDYEVDEMEVEMEEDCLKILALHQPVASDLRFHHHRDQGQQRDRTDRRYRRQYRHAGAGDRQQQAQGPHRLSITAVCRKRSSPC